MPFLRLFCLDRIIYPSNTSKSNCFSFSCDRRRAPPFLLSMSKFDTHARRLLTYTKKERSRREKNKESWRIANVRKKNFYSWALSQLADRKEGRTRSSKNNGRRIYFFLPSAFISFFFFLYYAYIKKMHVSHCPSVNQRVRSSKIRSS